MCSLQNFNPHSPCGERLVLSTLLVLVILFQSTLPLRGATIIAGRINDLLKFQSTLPLRGATPGLVRVGAPGLISIHTPLAGSDKRRATVIIMTKYFNPHSPCGERPRVSDPSPLRLKFQSTLPLRGVTLRLRLRCRYRQISIHTPLAGSDPHRKPPQRQPKHFNPHSPCGERPGWPTGHEPYQQHFNPHSPCGERPRFLYTKEVHKIFQSTLPLRGATRRGALDRQRRTISIHTPLAGSDYLDRGHLGIANEFQSTLPLRGATARNCSNRPSLTHFNPHSPCGERLTQRIKQQNRRNISIHTPLAGSDTRNETFLTK